MSRCFRYGRDAGLHPKLLAFLDEIERRLVFDTLLVWGGRTPAQQLALYAQGRTVPGPNVSRSRPLGDIVTNAKDISDTAHGRFAAVDVVPLVGGRPDWADKAKFCDVGDLAEKLGLEWGGRFTRKKKLSTGVIVELPFFDGGHVQVKAWRDLPIPKEEEANGKERIA